MTEETTAADAKVFVADQDRKRALKAIADERAQLERATAALKKRKDRFERTIAKAISGKPDREDWYNHPGPLPASQVREVAALTPMKVHRLMARQRVRLAKGRRGK